jgi:hypothetical protein
MPFLHVSLNQGYIYPMMPIAKQCLPFTVGEGSGSLDVCIDSFTGINSNNYDNVTHGPQTHRKNMLVRWGDQVDVNNIAEI